jgi:gas vesicle protein
LDSAAWRSQRRALYFFNGLLEVALEGHRAGHSKADSLDPHSNDGRMHMRDRDDGPYYVIERESGGGVGPFLLGAILGAGVALLFAPRSGEETQRDLKERAGKLRDAAEERVREAQAQIEERLDQARAELMERVDAVREAVDSGRDAAREARGELEEKLERSKSAYRAGVDAARKAAKEEKPAAEAREEDN